MKTRALIHVLVAVACSAASSGYAKEGTVGNGGDVVVCSSSSSRPIELLDFYEGRSLRGFQPDLGGSALKLESKIQLVLKRYSAISPELAAILKQWASSFMAEAQFLRDANLVDIPDSKHIALPAGCGIQQIAIQREPRFDGEKRYFIDQDLWERLDTDNQAGLVIHELVYRHAKTFGRQTDSIFVRYLNSLMAADKYSELGSLGLLEIVKEFGYAELPVRMDSVTINAGSVRVDEDYGDGPVLVAYPYPGQSVRVGSEKFALLDDQEARFYRSGKIHSVFFSGVHQLALKQSRSPVEISVSIAFHEDGSIMEVATDKQPALVLENQIIRKRVDSLMWIELYPSGLVHGLSNIESFKTRNGLYCASFAKFHEDGTVSECTPAKPSGNSTQEARNGSFPDNASNQIELNEEGRVK